METTEKRKTLILEKPFLRKIYEEWYGLLISSFPQGKVPVLEIGSGGGFFGTLLPDLILSDIQPIRGIHAMFDACSPWPFQDGSLGAIVMVNVFHHLSHCCVRSGAELPRVQLSWSTSSTICPGPGSFWPKPTGFLADKG